MKRLLAFVALLVLGIILFSSVLRFVGWDEIWSAIQGFWGGKGVLLILLTFLMLFVGAIRWSEILRHQGYRVSFWSLLKQYFGGFALSFFFPMAFFGSELFRAYALREFHEVPLLWWILLASGMLALALLFFYLKSHRKESILRMFFPRLNDNNGFLEMEQEVLRFFRVRNRAFWEGLFLSFAKAAAALLRTFVLVAFLGGALGFFPALTITGFTFLSLLIPIPGQLGSHEALQVLSFQALGLEGHAGAAFAFLVRAAELVVALFALVLLLRMGAVLVRRLLVSRVERVFQKLF